MSKGSNRRPGTGYADNWDRIFGKNGRLEGTLFSKDDKPIKAIEPTPRCAEPFCSCEEGKCIINESPEVK